MPLWEFEKYEGGYWQAYDQAFGTMMTSMMQQFNKMQWSEDYGPQAPEGEWQHTLTGFVGYEIDFHAMTQTNMRNNSSRRIRLIEVHQPPLGLAPAQPPPLGEAPVFVLNHGTV